MQVELKSGKVVLKLISSDLYRYAGRTSTTILLKNYIFNRSFRYSFWYRLSLIEIPIIRHAAISMHRALSVKYSLQIPRAAKIGYGLYIGHPLCIVISSSASIGNNCNISQFVTIGSNTGKAATIGDNVYIGPNACLVERIFIGDNVTIGAGSVVIKDAPADHTVAGNPAKTVSTKQPGRFIQNKWQ